MKEQFLNSASLFEQSIIQRRKTAKKLYIAAWTVEIFAVLIGLGIAVVTAIYSFNSLYSDKTSSLGMGDYANIFIGTVPFLMVSVVELTKIPLAEAVYKTKQYIWKIIFLICLASLAVITFESALNGFERNFHARISSVDKPKKELVTVDETLENKQTEINKLSELTQQKIDDRYNTQYQELSVQKNTQVNRLNDQIKDIRARSETNYVKTKRAENQEYQSEIEQLNSQKDKALQNIENDFKVNLNASQREVEINRRNLQNQFQMESDKLSRLEEEAKDAISKASFFNESSVKDEQRLIIEKQSKIVENLRKELNSVDGSGVLSKNQKELTEAKVATSNEYDKKITNLRQKIAVNNQDISRSLGSKEKDNAQLIKGISEEIQKFENDFKTQIQVLKDQRDSDYALLKNFAQKKLELNNEVSKLNEKRVALREEINKKVGDSQIYRIAQWWKNKENAADVDRKDVATVATIWFGSLAFLIATTGIALAFASLVVGDLERIIHQANGGASAQKSVFEKLMISLRRYLVSSKLKKRIEYVEVEKLKYIDRDKVVFKEVPVEVVKKEIVYMPFYTNDKDLLNFTGGEMKDKVS